MSLRFGDGDLEIWRFGDLEMGDGRFGDGRWEIWRWELGLGRFGDMNLEIL
jgi:hypothetical protein